MVPGVEGSNPFIHPIVLGQESEQRLRLFTMKLMPKTGIMGCRQAVRHGTLTPALAGSIPAIPAIFNK